MTFRDLPTLNAVLNTTSRRAAPDRLVAHPPRPTRAPTAATMLAALATSTLFLVSYLAYHFEVGSVRFTGQGLVRTVYFAILVSHTVLAVAIVPLVLVTLPRALRGRFEAHRALARVTLPLWLWVSVSGVVVYWMLYG